VANKSGWWLLREYGIAAAGIAVCNISAVSDNTRAMVVTFVVLPALIWALIAMGCLRGTAGPNRFGPDPLGGRPTTEKSR
jgi:uncharacterized membrane protein YhaH (DUF805 family)